MNMVIFCQQSLSMKEDLGRVKGPTSKNKLKFRFKLLNLSITTSVTI
jgi:hypothetical protein